MRVGSVRTLAGLAGGLAAFIWASYYVLLLLLPGVPDATVIVVPFAVGGLAFLAGFPGRTSGSRGTLLRRLLTVRGLLQGGLFLLLQLDVVLATRWAGAVDASLVTLLADVVATPLLVFALFREDTERFRSPSFWLGVVIAAGGSVGAIAGGRSGGPLSLAGLLALLPLPFLVAVFFVWVNQEGRRTSVGDVLGASALMAALLGTVGALAVLGIAWLSVPVSPYDWLVLVVMGLSSFYLAQWAYFWAAGKTTILIPAVLQSLIPVFTLLLVAALRFPVPPLAWLGVPLAFAGSAIAVLAPPSEGAPGEERKRA